MMEVKKNDQLSHLSALRNSFVNYFVEARIIRPPQIEDAEEMRKPRPLVRYHGNLPSIDDPWYPFLYAATLRRIVHKPPHALERLGPLMRKTQYLVRVEIRYRVIFLVETIDDNGRLIFVEIDRHLLERPLDAAVLPEWLQGMFAPNFGTDLEWACNEWGHQSIFRCSSWSRLGTSWW